MQARLLLLLLLLNWLEKLGDCSTRRHLNQIKQRIATEITEENTLIKCMQSSADTQHTTGRPK